MLSTEEALSRLQSVFNQTFVEPVVVKSELSASDVQEWDSLSHITLVLNIEETFGIRFKMGEVARAKNIEELVRIIQSKI